MRLFPALKFDDYMVTFSITCFRLKVKVLIVQSCLRLSASPLGYSVHRTLQARILEWVAISSSRGLSLPRNRTRVSCISGRFFTV